MELLESGGEQLGRPGHSRTGGVARGRKQRGNGERGNLVGVILAG